MKHLQILACFVHLQIFLQLPGLSWSHDLHQVQVSLQKMDNDSWPNELGSQLIQGLIEALKWDQINNGSGLGNFKFSVI